MNRNQLLNTFEFYDQFIINNKIRSITAIKFDAFVFHWQRMLYRKRNICNMQFVGKALLIGRLQQSRPDISVYFDSTTDNFIG